MRKREARPEFGRLISTTIDDKELDKEQVAVRAGIDPSTLYRTLRGDVGTSKGTAYAIISSVNELAGDDPIDFGHAMQLAGYEFDGEPPRSGMERTMAMIIDNVAQLDPAGQLDVLAITKALVARKRR